MKPGLEFKYSRVNYSIKYSVDLIFRKIESGLFIVLAIFFIISSKFEKNFVKTISESIINVSTPLIGAFSLPFNATINLVTNYHELVMAQRENQALKEENQKMRALYISAINIYNENKELKNTLRFIKSKSSTYKMGQVVAKSHHILNRSLIINIGKKDGVKEGSIVTGSQGVVGRISEVLEESSRVALLTDPNSRIPVITAKARTKGILGGNNSQLIEILYLQKNHNIQVGDLVFTSSDGDIVPPGLFIGVVKKSNKRSVVVEMVEDVENLDAVTVIDY